MRVTSPAGSSCRGSSSTPRKDSQFLLGSSVSPGQLCHVKGDVTPGHYALYEGCYTSGALCPCVYGALPLTGGGGGGGGTEQPMVAILPST